MANPMNSRCGEEGCDCGYVIEKLMRLLQEIWDTVPSEFEGPELERHSTVLCKIDPTLEEARR